MTPLDNPRRDIVVIAFAVLALAAPGGVWAQGGADLSGTWVLNAELSDDPQEEFRRWAQSRGMPAPPGGGAGEAGAADGEGGGDYDAAGAGGGAGGPGAGLMAMMQSVSRGAERLVIEQEGDQVTITNASGQASTLTTDGKVVEREGAQGGGTTKIKSRWKKDKMIVNVDLPQRSSPMGGMITPNIQMTYSLDKNGRLELATTVGVGAQLAPFTVERVYDREAAAPPG